MSRPPEVLATMWPERWARKRALWGGRVDRQNKELMLGLETDPSKYKYWQKKCDEAGVPIHFRHDDLPLVKPTVWPHPRPLGNGLYATASSLRHAWHAHEIHRRWPKLVSVLEIGVGYGGLARAILMRNPGCCGRRLRYWALDDPIMLEMAQKTEGRIHPWRGKEVELAISINCLAEIPEAEVAHYCGIIRDKAHAFYTMNRPVEIPLEWPYEEEIIGKFAKRVYRSEYIEDFQHIEDFLVEKVENPAAD